MRVFNFDHLKEHIENLSEQIEKRNENQIKIQAALLAEDLEGYSRPLQSTYKMGTANLPPAIFNMGSDMCREMASHVRLAEQSWGYPEIAAQYVNRANEIFRESPFYPKSVR